MKRITAILGAAFAILFSLNLLAQVPNESLANGIIVARQKNATLMKQYNWNCRADIEQNGSRQDLRINLVTMNPDGTLQKTLLNDQQSALPNGFFRRAIAEDKRQKLEQLLLGLTGLLEQYTLPNPGAVVNFLSTAQVQPVTTPAGKTVLQVSGNNTITPGDTFSMTVDGQSLLPISVSVTTFYNGDPISISATFKSMKGGPNHLQYASINDSNQNLTILVHNYDYVPND